MSNTKSWSNIHISYRSN